MPFYHRGLVNSVVDKEKYDIVADAMCKRWSAEKNKECLDNVNHDHEYLLNTDIQNISEEGIDVHEEQVGLSNLPKNVIAVDKYRLVIELGHMIDQLKKGCEMCRILLNICNAKGVQTRGLGGWIYITCDNPACETMNKISIGKQHKKVVKDMDNPFNLYYKGVQSLT